MLKKCLLLKNQNFPARHICSKSSWSIAFVRKYICICICMPNKILEYYTYLLFYSNIRISFFVRSLSKTLHFQSINSRYGHSANEDTLRIPGVRLGNENVARF